jgi:hypothetical protein
VKYSRPMSCAGALEQSSMPITRSAARLIPWQPDR